MWAASVLRLSTNTAPLPCVESPVEVAYRNSIETVDDRHMTQELPIELPFKALLGSLFTWPTATVATMASEWGRAATEEELKQMVPTLHVYDHCPFCVRARMIFGLKKVPFKLNFLMNDDVVTPTKMTGKKVLPILEMEGQAMSESLDIVSKIDAIGGPVLAKAADRKDIDQWLTDNKELIRTAGWFDRK